MKFECESCNAQYMIADEKLGERGVKVKCKRCSHVIIVRPAASVASGEVSDPPVEEPGDLGIGEDDIALGGSDGAEDGPTGTSARFDGDTEVGASVGHDADTEVAAPSSPDGGTGDDDDSGSTVVSSSPAGAFADLADHRDESDDAGGLDAAAGDARQEEDEEDEAGVDEEERAASSAFDSPLHGDDGPFGSVEDDDSEDETAIEPPRELAADPGLRSDSELDADPFFGEGGAPDASASDDEPPPPPAEAAAELEVPEPPPEQGFPEEDAPASMPDAGAGADLLDQELSGAFSQMFDAPGDDELEGRGPTQVLDIGRVEELRAASQRSELEDREIGGGLDEAFGAFGGALSDEAPEAPPSGEVDDDGDWHVAIDDEDVGPLSLRGLGEHIRAGSVDRESLVWRPGMDDWTPAGELPQVRPLFEQVPMPKIGGGEERGGEDSFNVGQPIDDLKPSPFDDDAPESGGANDPFGALPGFDTDEPDGSWQPHGLTEVYQAANLAEAAGGIGAPAPAPKGRGSDHDDDDDDDGWKPGAGSALASLVENEIQRIDHGDDEDEQSLPPAADDSLSLNLDDGGLGSFGLPNDEAATPPPMQGYSSSPPMASAPASLAPPASMGGMPMAPYGAGTSPLKNPIVLVAGGLGVLLFAVVVLLAIIALRSPQQTIAQASQPERAEAAAPAAVPAPEAAKPAVEEEAPKEPEPAEEAKADEAAEEAKEAEKEAAKAEAAATPEPPKATPKKASVASKPAARKQKVQRRQQRRQPPKQARQRPSRKGCDPILDLDCDAKPVARAQSQKVSLSPSDVLTVVRKNLGSVNSCGRKHGVKDTVKMEWRILKSGRTSSVRVLSAKYGNTPVGNCLTSAIKSWSFPRFSGKPPPPVKFPFKLKG